MNWIDSGVNLLDKRFTLEEVLNRSYQANVKHLLVISSDIQESLRAVELCYSQSKLKKELATDPKTNNLTDVDSLKLACTAGVHPHYAEQTNSTTWTKLRSIIADNPISAIGECGLDFNRNFSDQKSQLYAFESQLAIAAQYGLGVYLHERDAFDEQITLLDKYSGSLKFMVAHCFTGNTEQLNTYVELGCYIGITGWLCDSKRGIDLQQAVKNLPLSNLLLETDAPYLFPKTLKPRHSVNEPCNIPHIAEYLASIINCSVSDIQSHSYSNARRLFFNENI